MNPLMMMAMQMFKGGKNPEQIANNLIANNMGNNPMMNNLLNMAKNSNNKGLEQFARNMCKEKGIDFEKEYNNFISNFKNR